jgi:hypothetical protein
MFVDERNDVIFIVFVGGGLVGIVAVFSFYSH